MRILHVIDSLGRGGAETLLVGIVKAMPQHQHTIVLLQDENKFEKELNGVEVLSLGGSAPRSIIRWVAKLKKLIADRKPDIVHSHLYFSSVVARLATPPSVKLFFSNHCLQSFEAFKKPGLVWLERLTYKKRHTLISVSAAVEADYKQYIPIKGKHYVLHNFVEDVFFKPPESLPQIRPGASLHCVGVGRLAPQKNWPFLIRAFALLDPTLFSLDIYGQGPDQQPLLEQEIAVEHATNVHLRGLHTAISTVLDSYDLFILSSHYEGHPVSVLEAMAHSMPVALSDIPVMRETAGEAAAYFDLARPEDCAAVLQSLAENPARLEAMRQASYARATAIARKTHYIARLQSMYEGGVATH